MDWLNICQSNQARVKIKQWFKREKREELSLIHIFRKTGVKLGELQARHIQSFYLYELKTVSASTVIHEHANINKALKLSLIHIYFDASSA